MKLSEKGMLKLRSFVPIMNNFNVTTEDIEFEPDDFESGCFRNGKGHVTLTVEEAEKLMKLLELCEYWLTNNDVSYDCDAWASLLEERIEQSENGEFK